VAAAAPSGEAVDADDNMNLKAAAVAAAAGLPPAAPGGRALRKFKTFAEGSRVTVVVPPSDTSNGGAVTPKWHQLSPRAMSESGALTPERSFRRCTSVASGGSIFAAASRGASQQVMPLVQLLQVRSVWWGQAWHAVEGNVIVASFERCTWCVGCSCYCWGQRQLLCCERQGEVLMRVLIGFRL
jgi:hypothetical protein